MATKFAFEPDYIVPPGDTLRETLDAKGLSQADLSLRTGMAEKTISQIMNGIAPISYETAEKLELVTGVAASFWNRMELSYREGLTRREEVEKLANDVGWLAEIPVKILVERGFVQDTDQKPELVRRVLKFFGVSSVESWQSTWGKPCAQYRGKKVQAKRPGFVAAWLRMGEIQAEAIDCQPFNGTEFKRLLKEIRSLTTAPVAHWKPKLTALCANVGVGVVLTREIPRASLSGAARWLTKDKALIQLSLKYKTDDQIWFSFFHEAAHILLHGKRAVFVDDRMDEDSDEEREANSFAQDILIPRDHVVSLGKLKTKADIKKFAEGIGVSPGIVLGRLHYEKYLPYGTFADLKRQYEWA